MLAGFVAISIRSKTLRVPRGEAHMDSYIFQVAVCVEGGPRGRFKHITTAWCSPGPSRWKYPALFNSGPSMDIPGLAQETNKLSEGMCSGFTACDGGHPSQSKGRNL